MSTKASNTQQRRAPLSLTGGVSKNNPNQYSGKSLETNGNSNNGASAKNDNKLSASQKLEAVPNSTDSGESISKDVKKQQQNANGNESTKKNEKGDEKKTQNGAGKVATNGTAKEKQQNGSDKSENSNNSTNTNSTAKSGVRSNEKNITSTPAAKDEVSKSQEQKASAKGSTTRSNEKAAKEEVKAQEQICEKIEKETEKEKDKKKENTTEKIVEKETRSRRHDTNAAAVEAEKKQTEKLELPATRSSAAQCKTRGTPTKGIEKQTPRTNTPTKAVEKSSPSQRTRAVTTVVDDVEMEPLALESSSSPEKLKKTSTTSEVTAVAAPTIIHPPTATSTPGKPFTIIQQQKDKPQQSDIASSKSGIPIKIQHTIGGGSDGCLPDRDSAPRTFSQIGGRRSIRPLSEYTPSKFQSNLQFRESYRRINTELDVSSTTNSSMNVTVGSEAPNISSSFSFFGRGRKRDRTPPPSKFQQHTQSTIELQNDADYSPPKRARLDIFMSVVASPLTLLRSRFSKASIQSSTPVKLNTADDDESEVQNVSGISIEEEIIENTENVEKTATEDVTVGKKMDDDTTPKQLLDSPMKVDEKTGIEKTNGEDDEIVEKKTGPELTYLNEVVKAGVADTSVTSAKNRRCNIM